MTLRAPPLPATVAGAGATTRAGAATRWGVAGLLALFLVLATAYGGVVPLWEAPDEPGHFQFVRYLAEGNGLPVQGPVREQNPVRYGSQPPLYYLTGAALTFWLPMENLWVLESNRHFTFDASFSGGVNTVWHLSPEEAFPWRGGILAAHLVRLLSTLYGAGTVLFTFLFVRTLLPRRAALALGAAGLVATLPQFLFVHGAVNNDTLVTLCLTFGLWLLARRLRGVAGRGDDLGLGLALGLGALAKLSGLTLAPLVALVVVYVAWRDRRTEGVRAALVAIAGPGLRVVAVALAVSGWWFARNLALYGDPLGWGRWTTTRSDLVRDRPMKLEEVVEGAPVLFRSFWGVFGWMNVELPEGWYTAALAASLLAGLGLLVALAVAVRRRERVELEAMGLALAAVAVTYVAVVRFAATFGGSGWQGRYLFGAVAAIALLLVLGWDALLARRATALLAGLVPLALGAGAVAALALVVAPAYAVEQPLPEGAWPAGEPITFGGELTLVAWEAALRRDGAALDTTLYLRAEPGIARDLGLSLALVGTEGRLARWRGAPLRGTRPTRRWPAGAVFAQRTTLPLPAGATGAVLELEVYDLGDEDTVLRPNLRARGKGERAALGWLWLAAPAALPAPPRPLDFGGILLAGVGQPPGRLAAGEELRLRLRWRAEAATPRRLTAFLHLADASGRPVAQDDRPLGGDLYPTPLWRPGETWEDEHLARVPADLPPGRYRLLLGLYQEDGARLRLPDGADAAQVGTVEVVPEARPE